MPFNGAGSFSLIYNWQQDAAQGINISSSRMMTQENDIAAGLSDCMTRDGQSPPTANIPMGGFRLTNMANANAQGNAITVMDMQNQTVTTLSAVSGTDTITASATPAPGAYAAGQTFRFVSAGANLTGNLTLNVNALGAKNIVMPGGALVPVGGIPNAAIVTVTYDGTQFQIAGIVASTTVIGYGRNVNSVLVNQGPTIPLAADEIVLETALGGTVYKFKSVSLNCNISSSGLNGWDSGTAPANGIAAVYWMYNPTTGVLGSLATNATSVKATEIYSAGNAPAGFTVSGLFGILPLGTVNFTFAPFVLTDRKTDWAGTNILTGSSFVGGPTARPSTAIPLNARFVSGFSQMGSSAATSISQTITSANVASVGGQFNAQTLPSAGSVAIPFRVAISTSQTIYQTTANSAGTPSFTIGINSYEF